MIVWFLQPHYPYLSRRFVYVSIINRASMNRWPLIAQYHKAFGNNLLWLFKIIKGHMSRIRIKSLAQVPYLVVENNTSQYEAVRKAIRYPIHLFIT